ncbi:MAG: DUF262 domain-containing HNH endonuclease family protein [Rubrivivax sp.]
MSDLLAVQHRIPNYQRDYVWARPQVQQLWSDLIGHYRKHSLNDELKSPEGYFLGAMVVIGDQQEFEVVDGQQRLTTLSTVLGVLYDRLQELPTSVEREGFEEVAKKSLARFVGGQFLSNIQFPDEGLTNFFLRSLRLERSKEQKELYWAATPAAELLASKRSTASRIREAISVGYEQLTEFLADASGPSERLKRLISFFRLVTECIVILRISAQSHTNAYAVFESLNNRGVRLSQADLIKNELLKNASATSRDDLVDQWNSAKEAVETGDFVSMPEFLHLSYLSRYGHTKANDLLKNVTTKVASNTSFAVTYSEEIAADAKALDMLTEHFEAHWTSDTHAMLRDLRHVLGVKLCYPMLIAAYRKHSGSPSAFEKHVRLCMNFVFRYMKVLGSSIESLARVASEVAAKIRSDESTAQVASLLEKHAPDGQFKEFFLHLSVQETKLAFFVVYYLERQMLSGTLPVDHGDEQNLEHIMPRTPSDSQWPAAKAWKSSDPEDFKDHLWRIGNLLPLPGSINKSLKNREILHKLSNGTGIEYEAASLHLASPKRVRDYLDGGEWTKKSILDRQAALAEGYACKAWRLT